MRPTNELLPMFLLEFMELFPRRPQFSGLDCPRNLRENSRHGPVLKSDQPLPPGRNHSRLPGLRRLRAYGVGTGAQAGRQPQHALPRAARSAFGYRRAGLAPGAPGLEHGASVAADASRLRPGGSETGGGGVSGTRPGCCLPSASREPQNASIRI